MAFGNIATNESTTLITVMANGSVHVAAANDFGGGTLALEQVINGSIYAVTDSENSDAPYEWTSQFDKDVAFRAGDKIRLTLTGASSPSVDWLITGPVKIEPVLTASGWEV
jgi:hypothetical protein